LGIAQRDPRLIACKEIFGAFDNSANDGVEVQGSVDIFGQLSHYLGFSLTPGGFGIEVDILDSDRSLSGKQA
jgi:hypothetical protein